jgi:hypothetical protein
VGVMNTTKHPWHCPTSYPAGGSSPQANHEQEKNAAQMEACESKAGGSDEPASESNSAPHSRNTAGPGEVRCAGSGRTPAQQQICRAISCKPGVRYVCRMQQTTRNTIRTRCTQGMGCVQSKLIRRNSKSQKRRLVVIC